MARNAIQGRARAYRSLFIPPTTFAVAQPLLKPTEQRHDAQTGHEPREDGHEARFNGMRPCVIRSVVHRTGFN